MFSSRLSLAAVTAACLITASGAAADPLDTFTGTASPSRVQPSATGSYTISLTSDPLSPNRAQRATIGIPSGFTVDPVSVQATTTAVAGTCDVATWEADGAIIAAQKIQLRRPGGNASALCPGATLKVAFTAVSAATDGTYSWPSGLVNDATGAFTLVGPAPSVVVDGTAPTTTITGKPNNSTNATAASFSFTASEGGSTFSCRLDRAAFEACTSPQSYTGLADGPHNFNVRATDQVGNTGTAAAVAWTIDTVGPTASITAKPTNPTRDNSPSFAFSANEGGSSFSCRIDTAAFAPCTSPTGYILGDGLHTFAVRATDALGNVGPVTSFSWTIDTVPPSVQITQKPNSPSGSSSPTFAFTSSESGSTFDCRLEQGAFTPCTSPKGYGPLTEGQHAFAVRATDAAGNTGVAATHSWTIDTVAPTVVIVQKPSNFASTSSATFAFTASENGSSFSCRLDESGFVPCPSPVTYNHLSDGPHIFSVRAIDTAGNAGPDVPYGWTIESRAPTASVTLAPPGLSNSRSATFGFAADEPSTFQCKQDDGGFEPCTSPASYAGLGDGAHVFSVRARDAVGNLSVPVSHAWTIDATAPETTLTAVPTSGTATSATFAFAASEGGTFECRLDGAPFAPCGSPKSYAGLIRADHQFEVRAIDAAGNVDATPSLHTWKVTAPTARKAASALMSPAAGARVARPPLLVWRRVAGAQYYNVQIFRGRRKVLSGWPTRTRLQLRAQWKYLGRKERLLPGRYRWYVWPGYTNPRRYGAVLGQSTFVVARTSRR
jgi:hypothetical protein